MRERQGGPPAAERRVKGKGFDLAEAECELLWLLTPGAILLGWVRAEELGPSRKSYREGKTTGIVLFQPASWERIVQPDGAGQVAIGYALQTLPVEEVALEWASVTAWTGLPKDGELAQMHRDAFDPRRSGLVLPPPGSRVAGHA